MPESYSTFHWYSGIGIIAGIHPFAEILSAFPVIFNNVCCCGRGGVSDGCANDVRYDVWISVKVISDGFFFVHEISPGLIVIRSWISASTKPPDSCRLGKVLGCPERNLSHSFFTIFSVPSRIIPRLLTIAQ